MRLPLSWLKYQTLFSGFPLPRGGFAPFFLGGFPWSSREESGGRCCLSLRLVASLAPSRTVSSTRALLHGRQLPLRRALAPPGLSGGFCGWLGSCLSFFQVGQTLQIGQTKTHGIFLRVLVFRAVCLGFKGNHKEDPGQFWGCES